MRFIHIEQHTTKNKGDHEDPPAKTAQKRRRLLTSPSTFPVLLPLLFGAFWGTEVSSSASWWYDTSADQAFDLRSRRLLPFALAPAVVPPRALLAAEDLVVGP